MNRPAAFRFARLPAIWPYYFRALASTSRPKSGPVEIPPLSAEVDKLSIDADRLGRFQELVAAKHDGLMPPTYPQVLATPLYLAIFTARAFPMSSNGLIHLTNHIEVLGDLDAKQKLRIVAAIDSYQPAPRGLEIQLLTTVTNSSDTVVWRARSGLLAKMQTDNRARPKRGMRAATGMKLVSSWEAARNIGRRYARVSGDYNPIHLTGLTAKLFGFAAPIAHGMWSKARVLSALEPLPPPPYEIDVQFTRPMLLPTKVSLVAAQQDDKQQFSLRGNHNGKAYLNGWLAPLRVS